MTSKNYDLAVAAARTLGDSSRSMFCDRLQLIANIDNWLGEWVDVDGKRKMVWPSDLVDASGIESRRRPA